MNENYKSNLQVSAESFKRGRDEEILFQKCVEKFKGFKCREASFKENKFKHIDFYISNGMSVDVKAHKKINATDKEVSTEYTWVEVLNVNGNLGWIDGWATHIAYSFTTHYKLFDRDALKKFVLSKIDPFRYKIKDSSEIIPYQVYRRPTLKDKIVLVSIKDLEQYVPYLELQRDENLLKD